MFYIFLNGNLKQIDSRRNLPPAKAAARMTDLNLSCVVVRLCVNDELIWLQCEK